MAETAYANLDIVALGDSITYSINHSDGWVAQLRALYPDATIINAGECADTLSQMEARMQSYVPVAGKRNIMIIWGGTNDLLLGSDPATAASDLASLVNEAKAEGWETWVVDALPRADVSQEAVQQFDSDVFGAVAADRFIDMYSYFTSGTGAADTALYAESPKYVHPNAQGDALIASVMAANIGNAVASADPLASLSRGLATSVNFVVATG